MRTESINGHEFVFYDSIDMLPICQFHLFGKYALVDSGIGSDLGSVDAHIERIASFVHTDPKKAVREILNYRRCLYSILNEADYRHKAFMCLVQYVDGKAWTDFSDAGIDKLYGMVMSASEQKVVAIEDEIKRKIDSELAEYFPETFDSSVDKNYLDLLRRRAFLQLSEIIDREDHTQEIKDLTDRIFNFYDPKNFEGKESAEVKFDKDFEQMCLILAKEFSGKVKDYTVMEFYSAQKLLKDEQEQMKKLKNKKK